MGDQLPKLVRDHIPSMIRSTGSTPIVRQVHDLELIRFLADKLVEESNEFAASPSLEELADVLEVVYAAAVKIGESIQLVEQKRQEKRAERGGFDSGYVLLGVEQH